MDFRIRGLDYEPFAPLFGWSEEELRRHGTVRRVAPPGSASPCRVSLKPATPGETLILTNFVHLDDPTSPYRSHGPIFVRRDAGKPWDRVNEVPPNLQGRALSLRAYDRHNMIVTAEVSTGDELPAAVARLFADNTIADLHVHYAAYGCFQCRVERA
jgi:hypothetical protein